MIPDSVSSVTPLPLPWLASFDVGDHRIDGEHRAILELANDLCAMALDDTPVKVLRGTARELIAVVESHFESEEMLFPAIDYPEYRSHVREHLSIRASMEALLLADILRNPPVATATCRMLLVEHILRHDLGFKTWVCASRGH